MKKRRSPSYKRNAQKKNSKRGVFDPEIYWTLQILTVGFLWLKLLGKQEETDEEMNAMDFGMTEV
jgi:hypothetical protein